MFALQCVSLDKYSILYIMVNNTQITMDNSTTQFALNPIEYTDISIIMFVIVVFLSYMGYLYIRKKRLALETRIYVENYLRSVETTSIETLDMSTQESDGEDIILSFTPLPI